MSQLLQDLLLAVLATDATTLVNEQLIHVSHMSCQMIQAIQLERKVTFPPVAADEVAILILGNDLS